MKPLALSEVNNLRYDRQSSKGHYESYFLRANHPSKPQAFWIRYTIFSPAGKPDEAIGELWGIFFDRDGENHAGKNEIPIGQCSFSQSELNVAFGSGKDAATLDEKKTSGVIKDKGKPLSWQLSYETTQPPLLDLPAYMYNMGFPKAKALVGRPLSKFNGVFRLGDREIEIKDWVGSQNHNWGEKHTDHYAWGQVAGFDNAEHVFLEVATARLKVGPLWTPFMTPLVLRVGDREYALNQIHTAFGRGDFQYYDWNFKASNDDIQLNGRIWADARDFVCLPYYNPPGGTKFCLNSKVARCELTVRFGDGGSETWRTESRAAFEILTDDASHNLDLAF